MSSLPLMGSGPSNGGSAISPLNYAPELWWGAVGTSYAQNAAGSTPATTNGQDVKYAQDHSGNTRHLTTPSGTGGVLWTDPATLRKTIRFNTVSNASYLETSAFTLNQPCTIMVVLRRRGWSPLGYCWIDGKGSDNVLRVSDTGTFPEVYPYAGSGFAPGKAVPLGAMCLVTIVLNGASTKIRVNKGSWATGNPGSANPGGITLGNAGSSRSIGTECEIGEGAVFAGAMSDANCDRLYDEYFQPGWLLGSIPVGVIHVMCLGDSLNRGYISGAVEAYPNSYPQQLQELLGYNYIVTNYGKDSDTLTGMLTRFNARPTGQFDTNVLAILGGTNDMSAFGQTAAQTLTAMSNLVSAATGDSWDHRIFTLPDSAGAGWPVDYDTRRADFNAGIVSGYAAGKVARLDNNSNIGDVGDSSNTDYFNADKIHWKAATNTIAANSMASTF